MKRYISYLMAVIVLCSCGTGEVRQLEGPVAIITEKSADTPLQSDEPKQELNDTLAPSSPPLEESDAHGISVEEGLLSVSLTLPKSFIEMDEDVFGIENLKKNPDFQDTKLNSDGSITIKMSKSKHQELLATLRASVDEAVTGTLTDENTAGYFTDIKVNKGCTEITASIKENETDFMQLFSLLGVEYVCLMYQAFDSNPTGKVKVTVINDTTRETIEEFYIPPDETENPDSN